MSEIRKATRQGVRPLIGLYSESGCGKTYSALLLARGFVGPQGKVAMIDSESGRGSLYADVIEGGYDVLDITEPFSPQAYITAIRKIEDAGYSIGIIDSGSHEWEGIGGVLDMAVANEERTGKPGLHCWKTPKLEHAKLMLKLLQSPIPWIVCLRAKFKSRQSKDERGKSQIIKDDFTTPIQADDFIFEMTAHGEIMPDHSFRLTKCSHPDLRKCFTDKAPITVKTGELVAQWCKAPTTQMKPSEPAKGPTEPPKGDAKGDAKGERPSEKAKIAAFKRKLWDLTRHVHHVSKEEDGDMMRTEEGRRELNQWLIDEAYIAETETLAGLKLIRLTEVVEQVEMKLKPKSQPDEQEPEEA